MKNFSVTQKILSFGATYKVTSSLSPVVSMTVKGKVFSISPRLDAYKGDDGELIATMQGNFLKSEFTVTKNSTEIGTIQFPIISIFKSFTLVIGDKVYKSSKGIISNKLTAKDDSGKVMLSIAKDFTFRDQFSVEADESIPDELAALAAIALDQRFFEGKN